MRSLKIYFHLALLYLAFFLSAMPDCLNAFGNRDYYVMLHLIPKFFHDLLGHPDIVR
ncbi:hypothetical protein M758_2G065200 [Ceratodon purpureus]|nr:hypothetical protein M758_2G065200 [Ceratodon purpureus]